MELQERKLVPDSRKGRVKLVETYAWMMSLRSREYEKMEDIYWLWRDLSNVLGDRLSVFLLTWGVNYATENFLFSVYLKRSKDLYGLRRLQWGPETEKGTQIEENIIVMPEEADFRKVGPENERVYELRFRDKSQILFFWMQEGDPTKDTELCQSFNSIINLPNACDVAYLVAGQGVPVQSSSSQRATGVPDAAALAQLLSQAASGRSGQVPSTSQGITLKQQGVLAAALLSSACGMPPKARGKRPIGPSLADILEPETLIKYVQQPDMLDRLAEYLPESQRSKNALLSQCQSPQLHQQLKVFSHALLSGRFDPAALGLSVEGYSTIDFLNAIQKSVDEKNKKDDS